MYAKPRSELTTIIAVLYVVLALPIILGGLAILIFGVPAVVTSVGLPDLPAPLFGLGIALLFTLGAGVLMVIDAVGLVARQEWARILALVLAVLMLPILPLGPIVGVIALWHLLQADARQEFAHLPQRM